MPSVTLPGHRPMRRMPIPVWGWLMLLVVLLSAVPTGGAPRSSLVGSAFDPASVSFALSPKRAKAASITVRTGERKPDEIASEVTVAAAGLVNRDSFPPVGSVKAAPARGRLEATAGRQDRQRGPHAPRAPPTA